MGLRYPVLITRNIYKTLRNLIRKCLNSIKCAGISEPFLTSSFIKFVKFRDTSRVMKGRKENNEGK